MKSKKALFQDILRKEWILGQERQMWALIQWTIVKISDPKREYWVNRLWRYYCNRFHSLTKCDWIEMLASMSDSQAYGRYLQDKAKAYCLLIRDAAKFVIGDDLETDYYEEQGGVCDGTEACGVYLFTDGGENGGRTEGRYSEGKRKLLCGET